MVDQSFWWTQNMSAQLLQNPQFSMKMKLICEHRGYIHKQSMGKVATPL
jgi:hypothetical protein